jgi:hypothetical protein
MSQMRPFKHEFVLILLLSEAYDLHVISVAGWHVYCGFRVPTYATPRQHSRALCCTAFATISPLSRLKQRLTRCRGTALVTTRA